MDTVKEILPLAITMMAGPQIISAIILITSKNAVKTSLAYISAIFLAATSATFVFYLIFHFLGISSLGSDGSSTISKVIESTLIALLFYLSIKTYINRNEVRTPKWMKYLQEVNVKNVFKLGLLLIFLMPSDIMIMITVAIHLVSRGAPFVDAIPFLILTVFIASLPLLIYLVFHKKAVEAMPKVRQWIDTNSWIIQIVVYAIFIVLIWK